MPSSNSERQAKWRQRRRDEKDQLEKELKTARTERDRLARQQNRATEAELAAANKRLAEMQREKARTEKAMLDLQQRNLQLNAHIEELYEELATSGATGENTLDAMTWQTLLSFDEKQLRQWVMAGRRFAQKNDESPIQTAIRWVIENRLD